MRFSNVRLLVKDYKKCFNFYAGQLGLEPAWGDENSGYASFKVADGIEGFALFVSDWMAPSVGNADKELPVGFREKSLVSFSVDNVDNTYMTLKDKGVIFVNEPTDMADWGARTVHLRDPEDNLIELFSPLAPDQYSEELIEENKKFQYIELFFQPFLDLVQQIDPFQRERTVMCLQVFQQFFSPQEYLRLVFRLEVTVLDQGLDCYFKA